MRIYTRIVIDMDTLEAISEESYEYRGPVALCADVGAEDPETGEPNDAPGGSMDGSPGGNIGGGAAAGGIAGPGATYGLQEFEPDTSGVDIAGAVIGSLIGALTGIPGASMLGSAIGKHAARGISKAALSDKVATETGMPKGTVDKAIDRAVEAGYLNSEDGGSDMVVLSNPQTSDSGSSSSAAAGFPYDPSIKIPGLTRKVKKTRSTGAEDPVEAYFKRYPEADAAYQAAKAKNPKWTAEAWARANFEQRKAAGQPAEWGAIEGEEEEYEEEEPMTLGDLISGRFDAAGDSIGELTGIQKEWGDFVDKYSGKVDAAETRYKENVASIPKLSVKAPAQFGGANIPMAPGKWINTYGNDLDNLLKSATTGAGIESTGLANRTNNALNRYSMGQQQYNDPLKEIFNILDLEKRIEGNLQGIKESKNDDDLWGSLIPAVAYGVGSYYGAKG